MNSSLFITVLCVLFGGCLNSEQATDSDSSSSQVVENVTKEMVKVLFSKHTNDSALIRLVDDDCFLCSQLKCIVQEEPCSHLLGETFKNVAPLVLKSNCRNCSPTEKDLVRITSMYVSQRFPNEWKKVLKLYT